MQKFKSFEYYCSTKQTVRWCQYLFLELNRQIRQWKSLTIFWNDNSIEWYSFIKDNTCTFCFVNFGNFTVLKWSKAYLSFLGQRYLPFSCTKKQTEHIIVYCHKSFFVCILSQKFVCLYNVTKVFRLPHIRNLMCIQMIPP